MMIITCIPLFFCINPLQKEQKNDDWCSRSLICIRLRFSFSLRSLRPTPPIRCPFGLVSTTSSNNAPDEIRALDRVMPLPRTKKPIVTGANSTSSMNAIGGNGGGSGANSTASSSSGSASINAAAAMAAVGSASSATPPPMPPPRRAASQQRFVSWFGTGFGLCGVCVLFLWR